MARKRIDELDSNLAVKAVTEPDALRWKAAGHKQFAVRALPWFAENEGAFIRFPRRAEKLLRPAVWNLAQHPAGGHIAFRTDSSRMAVRATIESVYVMPHMPATGSNGLSLYEGVPGQMRPWASAAGDDKDVTFERSLFNNVPRRMREYRLYLPLYMALHSLEIGLDSDARVLAPSPATIKKPVVFYGTSITQGGCAGTAGSDYVNTLGRLLNVEAINLGFSGNGCGDPEVAELMTEIDASLFVLDYAANTDAAGLRRTLPRFCEILRARHPQTPILIVTNVCFSQYAFSEASRTSLEDRRDAMIEAYIELRKAGDSNIHLADGFGLIPFGADAAYIDGVHPGDHGFQLMAHRLEPVLRQILLRDPGSK